MALMTTDLYGILLTMTVILGFLKYFILKENSLGFKIMLIGFLVYALPAFSPVGSIENLTGITIDSVIAPVINVVFIIGLFVYLAGMIKVLIECLKQ